MLSLSQCNRCLLFTCLRIFEFKLDGTADEALQQIEDKGYARLYEADERKLYRIGVSFSSETGTVSDWKVVE